jgi:hypothetical protein
MYIDADQSENVKNKCTQLKQIILTNIIRMHMQLKNTDETISDNIRDYTDDLNKKRKEKFETMLKVSPSKAAIYLISRTINMGDVFTKREEEHQKQVEMEAGGMGEFFAQAIGEEGEMLATTEGMEQFEQAQADMDAAQEFGMGNVHGEDEDYED